MDEIVLSRDTRPAYGPMRTRCLVWGGRMYRGYGRLSYRGKHARAHRVTYEARYGPVSAGLQLDHLCRNKACVNPLHLEAVTQAENSRRGSSTRLTKIEVAVVKQYAGRCTRKNFKALMAALGISDKHLRDILAGNWWSDVDVQSVVASRSK